VKKVKGGWKVVSYSTGKTLKRKYKTKKAAMNRAATSKRRSRRKRSNKSRRMY
jgi:threonine synthase